MDMSKSVTPPVEWKVPVYLVDQRSPEGLVLVSKSRQSHDPVVQIGTFVVVAHPLVVVFYNFLERIHDVRKETDSSQHEENSYDLFICWDRVVVSIPNSRKGGQSEVRNDDHLSLIVNLAPYLVQLLFAHGAQFFTKLWVGVII